MLLKLLKSKFIKINLLLAIFLMLSINIYSQVTGLLNFETPAFYLMPSEIGVDNNKWLVGSYLNTKQIVSNLPLRSYAISGNYQLLRGFHNLYLGAAMGDRALVSSPYHENELYITLAYHKIIRNQTFHMGIQPGILFRNLDMENILFPDQYDRNTGGFNPAIATNEPVDFLDKSVNLNLNLGLGYGLKYDKYYSKVVFAYRNLNKPNVSFVKNSRAIHQQFIIQNKNEVYISNDDKINAFLMVRSTKNKTEFFCGGEWVHNLLRYNVLINDISAGSYLALRNGKYPNNIVFDLGFGLQNFKIGMAYSYNFIGNKADKADFNSFELVLLFKGLNSALEQYRVPCEIY